MADPRARLSSSRLPMEPCLSRESTLALMAGEPMAGSGTGTGGGITVVQVEAILYGLLIIGFLLFEPKGLFGIWIRIRNYWNAWPFSY